MTDQDRSPKGAMVVWLVGLTVYLVAVFHRSSLAVAGLVAAERFDITASQLATFTMLQLLVYAGLQIPVGLALDRLGPRRVLTAGLITMTLGQVIFALVDSYGPALGARILVGAGDAMTFACVLRLVNTWFTPRRIPLITQLTGATGQLGSVAAAIPMTWAFAHLGWTRAYLVAAAVSAAVLVLMLLLVRDSPVASRVIGPRLSLPAVRTSLTESWRHPGTRLGFWTHFTCQFSANTMSLLWGYPFFVLGEGRSSRTAGLLLTVLVLAAMASGPVLAAFTTRHPWHRSNLVIGVIGSIMFVWTVVLLWPGQAPIWLLMLLVVVVGAGGPGAMIGFDYGREFNPDHRLGAATGIINQGGFYASLLCVVAIGMMLDWRTPGGGPDYTPEAFVWAMSVQYVLWFLGLGQVLRQRRRARAHVQAQAS